MLIMTLLQQRLLGLITLIGLGSLTLIFHLLDTNRMLVDILDIFLQDLISRLSEGWLLSLQFMNVFILELDLILKYVLIGVCHIILKSILILILRLLLFLIQMFEGPLFNGSGITRLYFSVHH